MTTAVFRGGPHGGFGSRKTPTFGAGQIAGRLLEVGRQFFEDAARSAMGSIRWSDPLVQLFQSYDETRTLAGNGEYRLPSPAAVREAIELIESLPSWAPPPTPVMEPSGAIALEWELGHGRFFVLAVDGTGRIEYSAILGLGDENFGVVNFAGRIPPRAQALLVELIRGSM
jgi:hypothetical protein